jgi:hypothetical protein
MAKLDPIVSEFATEEEAEAYDKWFRAQVEEGLRSKGPWIPHEQVMREARQIVAKAKAASPAHRNLSSIQILS